MSNLSRRTVVSSAAAALPALAVPATMIGADPIFAAIERHRQAEAAYIAACHRVEGSPLSPEVEALEKIAFGLLDAADDQYAALTAMTPTTVAGCAALLRHLEGHEAKYAHEGEVLFSDSGSDEIRAAGKSLLSRIASILDAS